MTEKRIASSHVIENRIFSIRGQKVILDSSLAEIYGVSTKRLNEQVKRNKSRFPEDFMFRLTNDETVRLRSQNATSKEGRGGRRYQPFVFTEHGAIMAANVLNSSKAVHMSVLVVRTFVKLREILASNKDLARRLEDLERKFNVHDHQFQAVFDAIREIMKASEKPKKKIGFISE